jgi:hypothetical protein
MAGCCARAASGQDSEDAAAPPSIVMNWRRLMRCPEVVIDLCAKFTRITGRPGGV